MKKLLSILSAIFIFALPTMAKTDFTTYCPQPPAQKFKVSKITGMNWLSEQIAESIIKKELKKETKGKFKVKMKSYGTLDLINGKFSYLSMDGKNLNVDGTHISNFSSTTMCEYNSVKLNKDNIQFRENMVLNYELKIDNDALSQTLIDTGYVETIKKFGIPINDISTQIRNNKVYFIFEIPTFVTKPVKVTLSSGLNVKNGKIHLSGLQSNSTVNSKKLLYILEQTNPLSFTSDIMDNKKSKLYVDSVKIINDTIVIKGLVLIPKNV